MPLDPTIISKLGQGVTPVENPMDVQGKWQSLQMNNMALQQKRQELADAPANNASKQTLQNKNVEAADWNAKSAMLDHIDKSNAAELNLYSAATPENWAMVRPKIQEIEAIHGGKPDAIPDVFDPAHIQSGIETHTTAAQRIAQAKLKHDQDIADKKAANDASWKQKEFGLKERDTAAREMNARKPSGGMGYPSTNPAANAGSATERLSGVPQNVQALVKAVGTYRVLTTQLSPRQKNEIMGYVTQVFPNYSVGDADANHKLIMDLAGSSPASMGGTVGASERLLGHIGETADLTDKLGNSSFGKLGNTVEQWASTSTGTGNAGDVKAFNLTKGKVIAELNKLANGGVPEAKQMADDVVTLQASDPPEVKYKVLKAAAQLGLEQTHAAEAKRDNIMGEFSPKNSLLSERAQSVVKRIWSKAKADAPELGQPTTGTGYTNTAITNNPSTHKVGETQLDNAGIKWLYSGGDYTNKANWKKVN